MVIDASGNFTFFPKIGVWGELQNLVTKPYQVVFCFQVIDKSKRIVQIIDL